MNPSITKKKEEKIYINCMQLLRGIEEETMQKNFQTLKYLVDLTYHDFLNVLTLMVFILDICDLTDTGQ
jgi:hypothetical protein